MDRYQLLQQAERDRSELQLLDAREVEVLTAEVTWITSEHSKVALSSARALVSGCVARAR